MLHGHSSQAESEPVTPPLARPEDSGVYREKVSEPILCLNTMDKDLMIAREHSRDETLDAVRGMCVLAMVVHHCINYFPAYSLFYWRFVSGTFPFLAGYLVTSVLVARATANQDRNYLGWRLLSRGIKLVALCVALNAALIFLLSLEHKSKPSSILALLENVALYGNYKTVSFSLLVPIGYTIALGGLLLLLRMMHWKVIVILGLIMFGYCAVAEEMLTRKEYYLSFLSIGVFGMMVGCASDWIVGKIANTTWYAIVPWLVMQALITSLGTVESYPIYCVNTMASLLLMSFVAQLGIKWEVDLRVLVLLGRYSLLLYLAQIAALGLLQIISRKMVLGMEVTGFWIAILVLGVGQLLVAAGADKLRRWYPFSDRVYGWVFR